MDFAERAARNEEIFREVNGRIERGAEMRERYRFVVLPGHEEPAIEGIVETTSDYFVVEKIGEAREQIDRDHPQQHHRD